MILKGSQRGSGQNLAVHLMRTDDNEHVRLHELRGFSGNDLREAFKETEAVSRGTRCRQYLFSLSLNPPEDARVSVADFESAIDRAETRLGLTGQPRAVVFHEKEGRRHAHCVWSRIDAETMTARPMSFFKVKLNGLSRDLYLDHGWEMPRGPAERGARDPTNFTLAEWQQAKRQGVDPRWLKAALQECWKRSDDARAFGQALKERGFHLARGDRRGFVIVDHDGTVHSLPRALALKTKEVRDRLGDGAALPSVTDAQKSVGERMTPAIRRHIAESRERFAKRSATLGRAKEEMTRQHRAAREALDNRQREERQAETKARAERLPRGLAGLWHRLTGKLYVSNFPEMLTLYRQGGINFLGVFQNAGAQIEARYGRETAGLWKKAVAHTLYRGLPDGDTLRDIEHRSGKTSVMVRGFNVSANQVSGSGDTLGEQARPLLQVEDIRAATGGETGLLDARDQGFYTVEMPEFWQRPEMDGLLRDVRRKPDKYA